ncbi:hypothetical protein LTR85_002805 [Meristemomyces frigidus]|nr:hypothetical protein LTR85_002805 [Meristemomyces frigidus]
MSTLIKSLDMPMILDDISSAGSPASSRSTCHLVISPALAHDARRLVDIEFHAFENERANQQLSYRDYTKPEHFERTVKIYMSALSTSNHDDSLPKLAVRQRADSIHDQATSSTATSFLKVTDTETGETLSFAKTDIKQYSREELLEPADIGHEHEPQMNRDWFALNERLRREYIGLAKHCYIGMLATQPCHQHNGAGTMLLNAILEDADDAGLEVYLEATDTAIPLYEKHGFVAVNEIRFDPSEYGVLGIGRERQTVMVRGALDEHGQRRKVRAWEVAVAQIKAAF